MGGNAGAELSLARRRLRAQLLSGPPAPNPVAATERLLAVQAQDPRGARLAVRARTGARTAADFDRALTAERSLVISWLNRGTLHLVRSEDYAWLHQLTSPPLFPGNARRLMQEGVPPHDAERGVRVIERALANEGPLTRMQLRERIAAAGVRTEGQALVHLLMLACLRGIAVRGPMVGRQHAYALVRDWLGTQPRAPRSWSLAELARRYLTGHGPADDADLARWAGLPLRDARAGLTAIGPELLERADGLLELRGTPRPRNLPPPRLLGAFEPALLGWRRRHFIVGRHEPAIVTGGLFRPFAIVDGRAVASWQIREGKLSIEPLEPVSSADLMALERDGENVVRYLGRAGDSRQM
jgi:Winged helix DNA-binding domain